VALAVASMYQLRQHHVLLQNQYLLITSQSKVRLTA
jgi:hypothetical protein